MRNPPWARDELILALDLYFRNNLTQMDKTNDEVIKLSKILNSLHIHSSIPDETLFRNPNGVTMKLANFMRFDPKSHGSGLARGGKLEEQIWNEFANRPDYLRKVAQSIIDNGSIRESEILDDEEEGFSEGTVLFRKHKVIERNRKIVNEVKSKALAEGNLRCVVCKFDFFKVYGEVGYGYIECHHTVPVSEYTSNMKTKAKDLALVCSNCHRMLHRRRPWLTIDSLQNLISQDEH
ncbi:5-methylcytosine-specific restriction enzyme A [Desulfosporosinus hippei DSM 8344]|uniref:5-methylcytosine-specific restriction enzyme A n=2 Tax=Desulfosporosinus TaxID=79206 RepID=A0A1G7Z6D7_9FIRM|nr:5-methylcytosine-specific restriction enzyme A [Desulfosporosinus hippei DSM 8344]